MSFVSLLATDLALRSLTGQVVPGGIDDQVKQATIPIEQRLNTDQLNQAIGQVTAGSAVAGQLQAQAAGSAVAAAQRAQLFDRVIDQWVADQAAAQLENNMAQSLAKIAANLPSTTPDLGQIPTIPSAVAAAQQDVAGRGEEVLSGLVHSPRLAVVVL